MYDVEVEVVAEPDAVVDAAEVEVEVAVGELVAPCIARVTQYTKYVRKDISRTRCCDIRVVIICLSE